MKSKIFLTTLFFNFSLGLIFNYSQNLKSNYEEILLFCSDTNPYIASTEYQTEDIRDLGPYGPHHLFDKNPQTCWIEGSNKSGIKEYFICELPDYSQKLFIRNGNCKSDNDFEKFNRCKEISFQIYIAGHILGNEIQVFCVYEGIKYEKKIFSLKDNNEIQTFNLNLNWNDIIKKKNNFLNKYVETYSLVNKDEAIVKVLVKIQIEDVYLGKDLLGASISDVWFSE